MSSIIIQEFIQSLDEEIEAIKHGKGGSIVKVFNGRFLREISGLFIYIFNLENFLAVLDESPAEIEIHGNRYPAQVLLTQGLEVEVGVEHFLGRFIPEARLQTDLSYLLERLKKKYAECLSGEAKVDFNLSETIFSGKQINFKSTNHAEINYSVSKDQPNEAQRRAIEDSLSSQLSIIWGPPGTGKTQTIAWAIEAHLNAGRRVLLVSHANNAVDEAIEKVAGQLKPTPFYTEGKLIRLGKPQPEHFEKMTRDYELVLLDKIAERLGESLTKEKNVLEGEKVQLEDILVQFRNVRESLQVVRTLSSELSALKLSISEFSGKIDRVNDELAGLEETQERNRDKLIEAQSAGKIKRIFLGLNPQKIQRQMDQNNMVMDSKKRLSAEIIHRLQELENSKDIKEKEVSIAQTKSNTLLMALGIPIPELEDKMKGVEKQKDTLLSRITEINKQLEEIQRKVLSEAKLVATTLTKTFVAKQFPDMPFDVLILDEASMAPLPHIYWAASKCRKFVTIVGDFLQLPPICIADKPMAKKWLRRSIFTVLGISNVKDAQKDSRVKMLNMQYRMVPAISAIPEKLFYNNLLTDSDEVKNVHSADDSIAEKPLVLIETAEANPWCSRLSVGGRFNLYNALVSATLAKHITSKFDSIRKYEGNPNAKIGILTPYRAQARLINKIVRDWNLLDFIRTSTVHTFQGGEEPIVIFDSCEGSGTRVAPMLDDTKIDSDARLVLNVAVTRAKNRLYFVGHTKHLLSDIHPDSALAKIIHYFYENAQVINSKTLVDNYFTSDFDKWAGALLSTNSSTQEPVLGSLYTEKNFWARFFQDLKMVKERFIVLSPFVSLRRSSILMDYFRAMKSRGIEIRIYTRPKSQQIGEMANQANIVIEQLRDIGAKVIERRNMHQKVAILDNIIAWEGSLNILSHRDSGEHMRRFESPSAIEEIIRSL
jgi:superfamily I DNA and/or RNA helicase